MTACGRIRSSRCGPTSICRDELPQRGFGNPPGQTPGFELRVFFALAGALPEPDDAVAACVRSALRAGRSGHRQPRSARARRIVGHPIPYAMLARAAASIDVQDSARVHAAAPSCHGWRGAGPRDAVPPRRCDFRSGSSGHVTRRAPGDRRAILTGLTGRRLDMSGRRDATSPPDPRLSSRSGVRACAASPILLDTL